MRSEARLAALGLLALAGCGYSPNPASGTLKCGPVASCPDGYRCADGVTCWKNGETPRDGGGPGTGGTSGTSGTSGAGGSGGSGAASKFVGTWVFGATFTEVVACTDGSTATTNVAGDYVDVAAGTTAALTADYYCLWSLDLAATGTSTVIRTGNTCTKQDTSKTPPITYTWSGQSFTLTTTDGHNGTLDAQLPYDYQSTAGTGSCTNHFNGPVTK